MPTLRRLLPRALPVLAVGLAIAVTGVIGVGASSHREAPLISEDPVADSTDAYAFVSPDRPDTVTLVGDWIPFEQPAGGPNFNKFGDDVLYSFQVDNNGDAVADVGYEFRFKTSVGNRDTFLYNTGPIQSIDDKNLNIKQSYTVTEVRSGKRTVLGSDLPVAPANIGPRSTPDYGSLASAAVKDLPNGIKVFAGPRDDPFFVDLGSVFDLLGLRPLNQAHLIKQPTAPGVDNVAGYNVHAIALQVPTKLLTSGDDPVIGVWDTTYRRKQRVFADKGAKLNSSGSWVQISRLGMPLVNEVIVPLGKKDRFNASKPVSDAQFGALVLDPEPARLIPQLYPGVDVPKPPRNDLQAIFLTGIKDLNMPKNVKGSEMLRLNTSIPPTPLAQQDRLGLLANQKDGFPNGRRLVDDVTDIELRALAGGTPFTPDFNKAPNNALTDGVDANEWAFLPTFPYLALPHQGYAQPALG
jgi:hypothetical protein